MKLKTIIGIGLIVLSIAAMFVWENYGRDRLTTETILVCAEDMEEGDVVTQEKLGTLKVRSDNVLEGALRPGDSELLEGLAAGQRLYAGQQLMAEYFTPETRQVGKGKSIFVIPSEWILSRSSALRSGDDIAIYSMPTKTLLGRFKVAFVRDASEQEVRGMGDEGRTVLERSDSGRMISGIEIICGLQDYYKIYDNVMAIKEEKLAASEESGYIAYGDEDYNCLLIVMEDAV